MPLIFILDFLSKQVIFHANTDRMTVAFVFDDMTDKDIPEDIANYHY